MRQHYIATIAVLLLTAIPATAQLSRPTDTVKDTVWIKSCFYNNEEVPMADAPCTFFLESTSTIYIAGQEYKKGDRAILTNMDRMIVFPDATVNGKKAEFLKTNPKSELPTDDVYVIDNYKFYVSKEKPMPFLNNQTSDNTVASSFGSWDLGGRNIIGFLPKPSYDVMEEGRVVVTVTVNPAGDVIDAKINNRTDTTSRQLRNAALKAARECKFSKVSERSDQTGTITYYFKLR